MKEISVTEWCDYCWADGERRTPAVIGYVVGIKPVEITGRPPLANLLCCETHRKTLDDLAEVVREHGEPVDPRQIHPGRRTATRSAPTHGSATPCRICGEHFSGIIPHVWNVHLGGRPPGPETCPTCGWEPDSDVVKRPASVGRHRATAHGYDPAQEGYAVWESRQAAAKKSRRK